jgi:DNA-directed RNA polymerase specialized sigma24 family protein
MMTTFRSERPFPDAALRAHLVATAGQSHEDRYWGAVAILDNWVRDRIATLADRWPAADYDRAYDAYLRQMRRVVELADASRPLSGYIVGTVHFALHDSARRPGVQTVLAPDGALAFVAAPVCDPGASIHREDALRALRSAARRLKPEDVALLARALDGESPRDLVARAGVSHANARQLRSRAARMLARVLAQDPAWDPGWQADITPADAAWALS